MWLISLQDHNSPFDNTLQVEKHNLPSRSTDKPITRTAT